MPISRSKQSATEFFKGALPASGAYHSVSSSVVNVSEYAYGSVLISYVSAAVGGYPALKVFGSMDNSTFYPVSKEIGETTATDNGGTTKFTPWFFQFPDNCTVGSAVVETEGFKFMRIDCAESGSTGSPGVLTGSLVLFNK